MRENMRAMQATRQAPKRRREGRTIRKKVSAVLPEKLHRAVDRLVPVKVYKSVLDFFQPEIVGRKCKLHHLIPAFSGEFVLDIDRVRFGHR